MFTHYDLKDFALPILVAFLISMVTSNAGVFLTGNDLLGDPNATFPTRPPILTGSELNFDPGTLNVGIVVDYYWKAPNTVSLGDTLSVSLTTRRLAVQFADYDFGVLVTDGTNGIGGFIADNGNGSALNWQSSHSATQASNTGPGASFIFSGAGYPNVGELLTVNFDITVNQSTTDVDIEFLNGAGSYTANTALDLSNSLRLLIIADEAYAPLNVASINLEPAADTVPVVPEPSTYTLILAGLIGLSVVRRKRKN